MRPACFGLLSLLAACTSADVLRIEPTPRPVQARAAVPVLLDEPTQPYRSIALIEVTSEWDASLDRMGRRLATEAAKLGGDAVLVVPRSASSPKSRLIGKVIVYRQPSSPADSSAATIRPLPR